MSPVRTSPVALIALSLVAVHITAAAGQTLTADEKELAAYRLTMPTIKKVMAVVQGLAGQMAQDPDQQELAKLEARIEALDEKEELTEAEQAERDKLREREDALREKIDNAGDPDAAADDPDSLDEMEAQITRVPGAVQAFAREGLRPREYALCMLALMQASLVEGLSQGTADLSKLPPGVNPENVRFVREHKAELAALQAATASKK